MVGFHGITGSYRSYNITMCRFPFLPLFKVFSIGLVRSYLLPVTMIAHLSDWIACCVGQSFFVYCIFIFPIRWCVFFLLFHSELFFNWTGFCTWHDWHLVGLPYFRLCSSIKLWCFHICINVGLLFLPTSCPSNTWLKVLILFGDKLRFLWWDLYCFFCRMKLFWLL